MTKKGWWGSSVLAEAHSQLESLGVAVQCGSSSHTTTYHSERPVAKRNFA